MFKWAKAWVVGVTVVLFVIGASGTSAGQQVQVDVGKGMNQAAIQRSRAVQAELARIEANKEAFIDEMFQRWAPALDPTLYDIWTELKPIAMEATPWRLLGASLTSDFPSALRVLRGKVGPGTYVSAFVDGRLASGSGTMATQAGSPVPGSTGIGIQADIGTEASALVFTPIAPCRMVDTRYATGGIVVPATPRAFDLTTEGFTEGQGGQTSCSGIPTYSHKAWAVNITVTGYSALGHLTVYPYGGTLPSTSFMNFFTTAYAMANAGTVTGCAGCSNDIRIAVSTPTHVIIDVVGYYEEATGFATGTLTDFAGTQVTGIGPGDYGVALGGACPAGTVIVSGAVDTTSGMGYVLAAEQTIASGTTWHQVVRNISTTNTYSATAYSRCMDVQ